MKQILFICIALGTLAFYSCKKDSESDVPNTLVDIRLYLSQYPDNTLNTVGNWIYVSGGVRGIVVYAYAHEQFIAIERNCTYQSNNSNAVVSVDTSNSLFLKDASCGSEFYLTDASVAHGPATIPLKQYHTSYNPAAKVLHIYN